LLVTQLTDFGLSDTYAGVMKGVILARAQGVDIVDLSHEVAPQAAHEAAFLLETAWRFFPPGTVHLAVVDAGVGTDRKRLALSAGGHIFVGPDNGVLSGALRADWRGMRTASEGYLARPGPMPPDVTARYIENDALFLQPVSATFEGRDVFAPVVAHLARGGDFADLGPPASQMLYFPAFQAPSVPQQGGVIGKPPDRVHIDGLILHVDRFGNLITDIVAADLPSHPTFTVAGRRLGLARTYGEADGPVAIAGSSGHIEIAAPNGNAALTLGTGRGDRVLVS
jgi:S-adenosylmethionine hydrolase